MARKKARPIGVEEAPKPARPAPSAPRVDISEETPSRSFSTPFTIYTCPHCNSAVQVDSIRAFTDHVRSCSRPSTANRQNASNASSVLSSPPPSPSQLPPSPTDADDGAQEVFRDAKKEIAHEDGVRQTNAKVVNEPADPAIDEKGDDDKLEPNDLEEPRPYVNPGVEFVYYEYNQPRSQPQADQTPQEAGFPGAESQEADSQEANYPEADGQESNAPDADTQEVDAQEVHLEATDPHANIQADQIKHQPNPQFDPRTEFQDYQADQADRLQTQSQTDSRTELQIEPQAGSDPDQKTFNASQSLSVPAGRFPFPKLTHPDAFARYLEDPEDMTYEELYHRTAVVSQTLVVWQKESDEVEAEILDYERNQKFEQKLAEEATKDMMERQRVIDDKERALVAKLYRQELKLKSEDFQEWLARDEEDLDNDTIRHLKNIRNPQFMAQARRAQQTAVSREKKLLNTPWPEIKPTKADLDWERRRNGRLMDSMIFDDKVQADAYGFEYSAHIKHRGDQPLKEMPHNLPVYQIANTMLNPSDGNPNTTSTSTRGRTQRKATRKVYEADVSVTPEESAEDDGQKIPLKRSRKPKIFIDGVETTERSRGQSRSGTPVVRTFASGKRVGRPPAKSKLQAVQLAQTFQTPDVASGSEALNARDAAQDEALKHQELAPSQEAQLHDAAESLVNQTQHENTAAAPVVKRKHAGGRPRKIKPEIAADTIEVPAQEAAQPKRKHPGGRPRKYPRPLDVDSENAADEEPKKKKLKPAPKRRGGRVESKAIPEEDLIQLGEENGVLQSTEQDDGSQYTSTATTRPTTSDSNATASTFGSRRSARAATREKTAAREARASAARRGSAAFQGSASLPTSSRIKRKRASSDTDPSPIVVEPIQVADPLTKKRRSRGKQESQDAIEAMPSFEPEVSIGLFNKRKRGNTINESIAVVPEVSTARFNKRKRDNTINESTVVALPELAPIEFAAPPKKRRRRRKVEDKAEPKAEVEEVDSDADIDEESLDPIAREALRKKRVKKAKSKKLSANMKERWAKGGMKEAQETRKANNAIKRAHKQQTLANEAAGLPPPPPPVLIRTAPTAGQASTAAVAQQPEPEQETTVETPAETPVETPYETPEEATPAPALAPVASKRKRAAAKAKPQSIISKRPASTRARKPTGRAMGFDGAGDEEDDELEQQFTSEYDHFQALTSPKKPMFLGKRQRKSYVDLSQLMDSNSEEDEEL